ncbi:MAG: polyhydroxyalkanoic acid system family protein [Porticoccus sp.]|jgi:putative polyhydroxyalkanoate system protein|uniref:polyhydroxyalkanoic acid system family protein n=1 Tax=Porticoccus sp. Uisw_050_02 TaxID=3230978 RepID=UPI0030AE5308|tara:strand:- start:1243 stop:1518 length:276 start_codon:yes stop_codon:yes gene_type:complete
MSKILIEKNHNMDELQLQDLIERLGKKLKDKFGGDYQLESNLAHYAYHGADAKISFDKSMVKVEVKLGLLMSAIRGKIELEINSYLDDYIT